MTAPDQTPQPSAPNPEAPADGMAQTDPKQSPGPNTEGQTS